MNEYQIPRNSLAWMLAAQAGVIAPHLGRLPIWIVLLCIGCGLWRVMVFQGRWSYPGRLTKLLFVLFSIVGVVAGYEGFGLDPAVGLLIVTFALKLLEMQRKRDAYTVILLAYFVALTQFLFEQTIPWTLYVLAVVTMITAALIGLNQTRSHLRPVKTFRTAGILLAQSMPLMVVLFVLFPRLSPLWTVPLEGGSVKSGVSETVSPGDVAELAQSDELAFRVTFDGETPSLSRLYWRGAVLTNFDGRTWHQEESAAYGRPWVKDRDEPGWLDNRELWGDRVDYTLILEPTYRRLLFSLTVPEAPPDESMAMIRDFRFYSFELLRNRVRYDLTSWLDYRLNMELSDFWRYRTTLLPEEGNERARQLAKAMYERAGNPADYVDRVLQFFVEQDFAYTLKPDRLGEDFIDEFLLETRRGFCEHYASAMAFMMRAVGIPARVVVGYLGGEYNPVGDYVAVYQFDAHAWTEVWLEGRGWVRVDPTSVVAPSRLERGLQAAVEQEESFLEDNPWSWLRWQTLWLTELRLQLAAIGLYWDSWVVGYTPDMQMSLLSDYLGDMDLRKLGAIMLAAFFSVLGLIGAFILMKRSRRGAQPLDREYLEFCRVMERQGVGRKTGEGPVHFARRIASARPDLRDAARRVTEIYVEQNYAGEGGDNPRRLRRAVRSARLNASTLKR